MRRRYNNFSSSKFGLLLGVLDTIADGPGMRRSVSWLRVLRWYGTRRGLRCTLRGVALHDRQVRFRRPLIMRYQGPEIGHHLHDG